MATSETWTNEQYVHYDLPNYTLYYIDRTDKQGGCCIYILNSTAELFEVFLKNMLIILRLLL